MTQELSTEVRNDAVLVFKDGSHKFIDENQHKAILGSINTDVRGFTIASTGEYFDYAMVSKVLTLSAFYEQYPQHKPEHTRDTWTEIKNSLPNQQIRKPCTKQRELMMQGWMKATGKSEQEFKHAFNFL